MQKIKEGEKCKPCCSIIGPTGPTGPTGLTGATGPIGLTGATGAPGTDVSFPQDGPNSGSGIARIDANSFNLA